MPPRINLHKAGLHCSPRLNDSQKEKATKVHVPFGNKTKSALLGLFTITSFVSSISLPRHQAGHNKTSTDHIIFRFEELNKNYDNTINEMHLFSFLTDISSNKVFTFHQAMKQDD